MRKNRNRSNQEEKLAAQRKNNQVSEDDEKYGLGCKIFENSAKDFLSQDFHWPVCLKSVMQPYIGATWTTNKSNAAPSHHILHIHMQLCIKTVCVFIIYLHKHMHMHTENLIHTNRCSQRDHLNSKYLKSLYFSACN